jgi:hypothetical protein
VPALDWLDRHLALAPVTPRNSQRKQPRNKLNYDVKLQTSTGTVHVRSTLARMHRLQKLSLRGDSERMTKPGHVGAHLSWQIGIVQPRSRLSFFFLAVKVPSNISHEGHSI